MMIRTVRFSYKKPYISRGSLHTVFEVHTQLVIGSVNQNKLFINQLFCEGIWANTWCVTSVVEYFDWSKN